MRSTNNLNYLLQEIHNLKEIKKKFSNYNNDDDNIIKKKRRKILLNFGNDEDEQILDSFIMQHFSNIYIEKQLILYIHTIQKK